MLLAAAPLPLAAEELDQHGKEHIWKGESGAVTVIDFAASWCPPCIQSLPRLERLASQYPEVRFLVVSVDKKKSGRDFLVDELGLELPVLWDREYQIAEHYRPESMPSTVVVDAAGKESIAMPASRRHPGGS